MRTIVLHDYFESLEGGGRLCSLLAQGLAMDLGYGFARPEHPFLNLFHFKHYNLNAYSKIPLWRQLRLARAFTSQPTFLKNYDTVIYSGFYTPLAIHHHLVGRNILYCHTPPRFIYDQRSFYLNLLPLGLRPALQALIHYLQPRYEKAVGQMDTIIANSENVRKRIRHYLGKSATVIYPPCDTRHLQWLGQNNYYLSMGRLDPLKQVHLIVQAFLKMPQKKLLVMSGGPEFSKLRRLANGAKHIHFTDWVEETTLAQLLGNSIATLYLPKEEDFGMSPVESMAAGKPVIGIAQGGLLETLIPGETGILLPPPLTVEAICEAVEIMTPQTALRMREACEKQAQLFKTEIFFEKMRILLGQP